MTEKSARFRGHEIEIVDDGTSASVSIDGEEVPVVRSDDGFAVAYLGPIEDLMDAAKTYVKLIPPKQGG